MTRKQIDASRERRLWITQVVLPVGGIIVTAMNIPEVRQAAGKGVNKVKESAKDLKNKWKMRKYTNIKG